MRRGHHVPRRGANTSPEQAAEKAYFGWILHPDPALAALLLLYRSVLRSEMPWLDELTRAKRSLIVSTARGVVVTDGNEALTIQGDTVADGSWFLAGHPTPPPSTTRFLGDLWREGDVFFAKGYSLREGDNDFEPISYYAELRQVGAWSGGEGMTECPVQHVGTVAWRDRVWFEVPMGETARDGYAYQAYSRVDNRRAPDADSWLLGPSSGENGCAFAMLGHPELRRLPSGTWIGFGSLC